MRKRGRPPTTGYDPATIRKRQKTLERVRRFNKRRQERLQTEPKLMDYAQNTTSLASYVMMDDATTFVHLQDLSMWTPSVPLRGAPHEELTAKVVDNAVQPNHEELDCIAPALLVNATSSIPDDHMQTGYISPPLPEGRKNWLTMRDDDAGCWGRDATNWTDVRLHVVEQISQDAIVCGYGGYADGNDDRQANDIQDVDEVGHAETDALDTEFTAHSFSEQPIHTFCSWFTEQNARNPPQDFHKDKNEYCDLETNVNEAFPSGLGEIASSCTKATLGQISPAQSTSKCAICQAREHNSRADATQKCLHADHQPSRRVDVADDADSASLWEWAVVYDYESVAAPSGVQGQLRVQQDGNLSHSGSGW